MFMVDEETAAAIQSAFREKGEWAAVVELRARFKITDNAEALKAVRVIAGWKSPARPLEAKPRRGSVVRLPTAGGRQPA